MDTKSLRSTKNSWKWPLESCARSNWSCWIISRYLSFIQSLMRLDRASHCILELWATRLWRMLAAFSPYPESSGCGLRNRGTSYFANIGRFRLNSSERSTQWKWLYPRNVGHLSLRDRVPVRVQTTYCILREWKRLVKRMRWIILKTWFPIKRVTLV